MSRDILELPSPPADKRCAYGSDPLQFGELRLPPGPGPHPVVVALHGGFWRNRYGLGYLGHLCAALTARGVATWNVEYRRIGDTGGGWPGTLHDVAAAADYVRMLALEHALDLERVVTIGHSAGGHLALWLAARRRLAAGSPLQSNNPLPLRGAIALGGVVDLHLAYELGLGDNVVQEFLGGTPESVPERYHNASPAELLPLATRQVLIHGHDDEPVPFVVAEHYAARAHAAGDNVTLHALPATGHFELVDPRSSQGQAVVQAVLVLLT